MATACDTREVITSPQLTSEAPRSRRVDPKRPASGFIPSSLNTTNHSSLLSSSQRSPNPASPPLPLRSPLRPPARSISSQSSGGTSRLSRATQDSLETPPSSEIDDSTIIVDFGSLTSFQMMQNQMQAFPSMNDLIDVIDANSEDDLLSKSLSVRPDSPLSLSLEDEGNAPPSSFLPVSQPTMTKRQHALHELLSSERAYASDLALIREVHIPLALGQSVPLQNVPASPPSSSSSSSRTLSTSSDSSTASLGPPMTQDDARIIFSNIAELALFSDLFCEELELALGAVVEGGTGDDHVGELFLRIIPELERPYKHYITRHPTALQHLQALPQTPALAAYLSYTRNVASSLSHAWDLASLLIKPVQRLLKYPLLLSAIIDETPDIHADKDNLKNARTRMEEVARNVNEGRRRAEVVKDVLTSKKKPVNVSVAASVNLGKMKNLRHGGGKAAHLEENSEAQQVEMMQAELKRIEVFAQQFAKNVVDWAKMMSKVILALRTWSLSFGKVIGLSADQGSEAFEAFLAVVEQQLMPLCVDLEAVINERLLKEIAHLLKTMNQPLKLLASMSEQEPFHYHLLNMTVSAKNRPPPSLLAASTNYLALRGQLAAELPQYLTLLHQGMAIFVRRLADIQTSFWKDIKDRWGDLWEMLRVEGELNAGYEETINVWQARWLDVDEVVASLNINQARKIYQEPERARPAVAAVHSMLSSLEPPHAPQYAKKSSNVTHMLSSLEPSYAAPFVSPPYALAPSVRTRGRGMGDDTPPAPPRRPIGRRNSNDSMHSFGNKSAKGKSPRRKSDRDEYADYVAVMAPYADGFLSNNANQTTSAIPRRKSMPLSPDKPNPRQGNPSPSRPAAAGYGYGGEEESLNRGQQYQQQYQQQQESYNPREREHSRVSRSPSTKRKVSDASRRPTQTRRRSSSITSFSRADRDTPTAGTTDHDHRQISSAQRDSWVNKPAKYVCQVIHPCQPPAAVSYFSFPFFTLIEGDLFEVLQEAGHPSIHPKLPLYVDDGEDCLLLCRDERGNVGWALASFLEPLNLSR